MHRWLLHASAALSLLAISSCAVEPSPAPAPIIEPPGPAPASCHPGEALLEGGACLPAGVPADACGQGFKADGSGGCVAILPDAQCPSGQMAVPGETACRDVAPCGEGTWGDIPTEANTSFVDAAYAGANGPSDGSKDAPWTTLKEGIDAADDGAIVAVAAGTYAENVVLQKKTVRVWGRCPGLVEVAGASGQPSIMILNGADGTEVRDLAIRGVDGAMLVSGSKELVLDRVWIHDSEGRGIEASDVIDETSMTLQRSLIEATREFGFIMAGVSVTIDATVIRGTETAADKSFGRGVSIQTNPESGGRSSAKVLGSVIEGNREVGVFVLGSTAIIDNTVVRDTKLSPDQTQGRGITIRSDPDTKHRSEATVRASIVERNHDVGVLVLGSDALIERTTVRSTKAQGDMTGGRGINIERDSETGERANAVVRSSLIEESIEFAIFVMAADVIIESTIARDTQVSADGTSGAGGINIQLDPKNGERASATVRSSVVEKSHEMGVFVSGSDALIEATVVRGTLPGVDDLFGRGINVQAHPGTKERGSAVIRSSLVEDSREMGILFLGSEGSVDETVVRDTSPRVSDGGFGDGLAVAAFQGHAAGCVVTGSHIAGSNRAGVASFGAILALGSSMVECNSIALDGEKLEGRDFEFEDRGGNACGCAGMTNACKVLSANLEPPSL